jgi:hypothetical protein
MRMLTVALLLGLALVMGSAMVRAQAGADVVSGHLVDMSCASWRAKEGKALGETHDKGCLLMADCIKSGYAVFTTDGRVIRLDPKGHAMALALVKKTDRVKDWRITVTGTVSNDAVRVISLTMQ